MGINRKGNIVSDKPAIMFTLPEEREEVGRHWKEESPSSTAERL